jgi:F-type H+-transporting ATPase subunit a
MSYKFELPDQIIFWQWNFITINATLVYTWIVMAIMVIGSWYITRKLSPSTRLSDGQNLLEIIVLNIGQQIKDISGKSPNSFIGFIGTMFLFIAVSNLLSIIPDPIYRAPTASLSTTSALAFCVFIAVPLYGIRHQGLKNYLKQYLQPNLFMLPLNIISEFSRTLALAMRLFGNMLSGTMIVGLLISLTPILMPTLMQLFGLLTGVIQAYIFAVLAMVFIASGMESQNIEDKPEDNLSMESNDY